MFGSDEDSDRSLSDITDGVQARRTRRQDIPCDFCGTEQGSVIYDRESETAWCHDCFNDPENHDG